MKSIRIWSLALVATLACSHASHARIVSIGQDAIDSATIVNALGNPTGETVVEGCFNDTSSAVSYYSFPVSGDLSNMPLHFAIQVPGGVLPSGSTWLANPSDVILQSGTSFSSIDLAADPFGPVQPTSGVYQINHVLPATATSVDNLLIRAEFFAGSAPESCIVAVAVAVPEPAFGVIAFGMAGLGLASRRRRR